MKKIISIGFLAALLISSLPLSPLVSAEERSLVPTIRHGLIYNKRSGNVYFAVYAYENLEPLVINPKSIEPNPFDNMPYPDPLEVYPKCLENKEENFALIWIDSITDNAEDKAFMMIFFLDFAVRDGTVVYKPENERLYEGTSYLFPFDVPISSTQSLRVCVDSFLDGLTFDTENRILRLRLVGFNPGRVVVCVPKGFCPRESVVVSIDNGPANWKFDNPKIYMGEEGEDYEYAINIWVPFHSPRTVGVEFGIPSNNQIYFLTIVLVSIIAVAGTLYWFKFRR